MAVTNLTGTKWVFNYSFGLPSDLNYNITFTSNNNSFTNINRNEEQYGYTSLRYNTTIVYTYDKGDPGTGGWWENDAYKTIEITGGTDVTNVSLISWIEANATQIVVPTAKTVINGLTPVKKMIGNTEVVKEVLNGVTVYERTAPIIVTKGDILYIDMTSSGTPQQYRVLKSVSGTTYEIFSLADVSTSIQFDSGNRNTYEGKTLDTYLNTTWYNTLSNTAKNALVAKTFTQDSWYEGTSGNPVYQGIRSGDNAYQVSLGNMSYGNEITRNVYALSVQDIIDYLEVTPEMTSSDTTLNYSNIWRMFWNASSSHSETIWLRSAKTPLVNSAVAVFGSSGVMSSNRADISYRARAAFQIDLTKIEWTKA